MANPGSMWKVVVVISFAIFVSACDARDQATPNGPEGSSFNRSVHQSAVLQHNEDRIRLEGKLRGSSIEPQASGRARWERRPDRTRFDVEVEDLEINGRYNVRVNDVYIASFFVTGGRGELALDSRSGSRIPLMHVGDIVTVLNAEGNIALIGHLRPE